MGLPTLEEAGTPITVLFGKDGKTRSEEYLLKDDDCLHVSVLSAPDTARTGW